VPSAAFRNTDVTWPGFDPACFGAVVCLYVLIDLLRGCCRAWRNESPTGQESRSTGHRAVRSVTVMCITTKPQRRQGMKAHVSSILLGVEDMDRSKRFYTEGLGWEVQNDYKISVFFVPHGGSLVGFYGRSGLADMVGASPEGSGFSGVVFNYVVRSEGRVDEVLDEAKKAGGKILKPAAKLEWGGYSGSFADPDGYIWNIGYSAQGKDQPYAE
jgi:predicted enzyme related to lactoylglutathione lyase